MNKVYERIDWKNEPSIDTPINERNLNKMDSAIDELDNRVVSNNAAIQTMGTQVRMVRDGTTLYITTTNAMDNAENTLY